MDRARARCDAQLSLLGALSEKPGQPDHSESVLAALATFEPAVVYALQAGGKRIRPCLVYAAARAVAGSEVDTEEQTQGSALDYTACALELIHTYSLIHDDLPAMDNDDLRRGRPTLHKAYDEATAILVGDGLQARAFELITAAPALSAEKKVSMISVLAQASGLAGMVGGQYIDIQATGNRLSLDELQAMHALKTGALIRAALVLGGIAAGASQAQLAALEAYGTHTGLAFQVVDDILDVESTTEALGKTNGKDAQANKATYVTLLGLAGAREIAEHLLDSALVAVEELDDSADMLRELARFIVHRRT
ncbi:farnesyl-diphosphate synthase [Kineobactrum sediminis]|uniref:Farnesyl-diphosphate synthase n=2 Tax=Kineobactrum sediminis TaxID=1905677 RepID=A0A2N5Y026_9GAMM|nr:farnesyl-diphosphate synthase [Kineobactrum sediminis]